MSQSLDKVTPRDAKIKKQPSENKSTLLALAAIISAMLLTALDQTIVNPAMPRIVADERKALPLDTPGGSPPVKNRRKLSAAGPVCRTGEGVTPE